MNVLPGRFQQLSTQQRQGCLIVALSSLVLIALLLVSGRGLFQQQIQSATPTPQYAPLAGRVFVTTLGTSSQEECLWNRPGFVGTLLDSVGCMPHGTPVDLLQSVWIIKPGQPGCHYYLVRSDDGLGGWIGDYALTQDLDLAPLHGCPERTLVTPTP